MKRLLVLVALLTVVAVLLLLPALAAAGMSTGDGTWIWQNPLPQGSTLLDVDIVGGPAGHGLEYAASLAGCVLKSYDQGHHWVAQRLPGNTGAVRGVAFIDWDTGCAVTDSGEIYKTTDGGHSWVEKLHLTDGSGFNAVTFADDWYGWAVGWGSGGTGLIYSTSDGGDTWSPDASNSATALNAVVCTSFQSAWAVGWSGSIVHLAQGGTVWAQQQVAGGATPSFKAVAAADSQTLVATGYAGACYQTTDGGATPWAQVTLPPEDPNADLVSVAFLNDGSGEGWAAGGSWETPVMLHTIDGGADWETQDSQSPAALDAVAQNGRAQLMAVGDYGVTVASSDGGGTWAALGSGERSSLSKGAVLASGALVAVGNPGYGGHEMLRTTDSGASWVGSAPVNGWSLFDVAFADSTHGWVVGPGGKVWATNDGSTWNAQTSPLSSVTQTVDCVNSQTAWMGGGGYVAYTTDGGTQWTAVDANVTSGYVNDVDFVDADNGWAAIGYYGGTYNSSGALRRSDDGGHSYSPVPMPADAGAIWAVKAQSYDQAIVCGRLGTLGPDGYVWSTTNGGVTWSTAGKLSDHTMNDVLRVTSQSWWVVGDAGAALHTGNGGTSWAPSDTGVGIGGSLHGLATDGAAVWAFGDGGAILKTTGSADTTAPTSSAGGWPAGTAAWVNKGFTVHAAGSDVDDAVETLCVWDTFVPPGGEPTTASVVTRDGASGDLAVAVDTTKHTTDGAHAAEYWAVDAHGNEQWPHDQATFNVDTRRPVPKAYASSGREGGKATLEYKATETGWFARTAKSVTMKVLNGHGKVVKTTKLSGRAVNKKLSYRFTCKLAPGHYSFKVYCTDQAGNAQAKAAVGKLTVK